MKYQTKNVQFELKNLNEDGTFSGYASTFGTVDLGLDVIEKGAFKKTLNERKNVRMLWQHDMDKPIGVYTLMQEDEKGLYVEGKLTKGVQLADEAYLLMKDGAIDSMSIGYNVVKDEMDQSTGIRKIKELKLWEVSLVTFPMNESATISEVKSATDGLNEDQMVEVMKFIKSLRGEPKPVEVVEFEFLGKKFKFDANSNDHLDTKEADNIVEDEPLDEALVNQFKSLLNTKKEK